MSFARTSGKRENLRCGQGHFRRAQARGHVAAIDQHARFAVARRHLQIRRADQLGHGELIMGVNTGFQHLERRRAICGPTIDIHQSQPGGKFLRYRAFSRARRAVNRDYQRFRHYLSLLVIGDL